MKSVLLAPVALLAVGLSGCIPKAEMETASPASGTCDASRVEKSIGKALTPDLGEKLKREAGAELLRTAHKDGMITMDYNASRLNIFHDDANIIVRINCG
jgi:Peptidase inhibitor I78 family